MENKNIKRMFLLILLTILLLGVVSATNTNDTSTSDKTQHNNIQQPSIEKTKINTGTEHTETKYKQIKKENKTLKKEAYNKSVSNYTQLVDTINEAKTTNYDEYIINLENGDYNATTSILWGNSVGTNNIPIKHLNTSMRKTFEGTDKDVSHVEFYGSKLDQVVKYGTTVNFEGYLEYDYGEISDAEIIMTIDEENFTTITNDNGMFEFKYLASKTGIYNVTVTYLGDERYTNATATTTLTVLKSTQITYLAQNSPDNGSILITSKLSDENNTAIQNVEISMIIRDKQDNQLNQSTGITNDNGEYTFIYPKSSEEQLINLKFEGNDEFYKSEITFEIDDNSINTYLKTSSDFQGIYEMTGYDGWGDEEYTLLYYLGLINETYNIRCELSDVYSIYDDYGYYEYHPLANQRVTININGTNFTAITDVNGKCNINYTPTEYGEFNITFYYPGNDVFKPITSSFPVKIKEIRIPSLELEMAYDNDYYYHPYDYSFNPDTEDAIMGMIYEINVKSDLTEEDVGEIVRTFNGEIVNFDTISWGYNIRPMSIGTNNLTIEYVVAGKTFASINQTINVVENEYNFYSNTDETSVINKTLDIKGSLKDKSGFVDSKTIYININGENYTTNVDWDGSFNYGYTPTILGTNNITFSVTDSTTGKIYTKNITVEIVAKEVTITVNEVGTVKYGNEITISGTLRNNYNDCEYKEIILNINGENKTTYTDWDGNYEYTFAPTILGTNNLSIIYVDDDDVFTKNTTFEVSNKTIAYFEISIPSTIKLGDEIVINGKLIDEYDNEITKSEVTLLVNNKTEILETDENGEFNHVYIPTTVGINEITFKYLGNDTYASITTTKELKVTLNYEITLNIEEWETFYAEDTININGTLTYNSTLRDDSTINILLFDGGLESILLNTSVKTDENGVYSTSFVPTKSYSNPYIQVSYADEMNDTHTLTRNIYILNPYSITLNVGDEYYIGEKIIINGKLTRNDVEVPNSLINIVLYHPWEDITLINTNTTTDENGNYAYNYTVPENLMIFDDYLVRVSYKDISNSKWIELVDIVAPDDIEINVNNYDELLDTIETLKHNSNDVITINLLPGNYNITNRASWTNSNGKTLIINGNGNTIDGKDNEEFILISNANAILENITVVNCNSRAIYITDSNVIINNSQINNNSGSHAKAIEVYENSDLTVENSQFNDNEGDDGGVFSIGKNNHVVINSSIFTNNGAKHGGAIYLDSNNRLEINNSVFIHNNAEDAGAIYGLEGNFANIRNSVFTNNSRPTLNVENNLSNTTIEEEKINTNLGVDVDSEVYVGERIYVSGQLYSEDDSIMSDAEIIILINEESDTIHTDEYGEFNYNFTPTVAGVYNVTIKFEGNEKYNSSNNTKTLEVKKIDTYIYTFYSDDIVLIGETITLSGYLYEDTYIEDPINNTDILIIVNDTSHIRQTDKNGAFYYEFTPTVAGVYNVTIKFEGNEKYNPSNNTKTIEFRKIDTYINQLDRVNSVILGESINIRGYLTYSYEKYPLNNMDMLIIINEISYTTQTDENGYFNYTFTPTVTGTYNVTIKFEGNEKYDQTNITQTIEVKDKLNTHISLEYYDNTVYIGESTYINGYVFDENEYSVDDSEILIYINGISYPSNMIDGEFFYRFTPTTLGTNNITIKYEGNEKYNTTNRTININIVKKDTDIAFDLEDIAYLGEPIYIGGYLRYGEYGSPINNTDILIIINEISYTRQTNQNGYFNYTFTPTTLGTNNITIKFEGNEKCYPSNKTRNINVIDLEGEKLNSTIEFELEDIAYIGESIHIEGYVLDDRGHNYPINNTDMLIIINEVSYTTKTNQNGYFNYTFTPTTLGTNNITIKFEGNEKYNPKNTTQTIEVKKLDTYISLYTDDIACSGESTRITGYLYDDRGYYSQPVKNADILLIINEITYQTTTNEYGNFEYYFTPTAVGSNKIKAKFEGNEKYNPSNNTKTIEVKSTLDAYISLYVDDIACSGESTFIYGYLYDERGQDYPIQNTNILLIFNGISYTTQTDENGEYSYTLMPTTTGIHDITAKFEGNQKYNPKNTTQTIEVKDSLNTHIRIYSNDYAYLDESTRISGYVYNEIGYNHPIKNVEILIIINGNNYTTQTNENGNYEYYFTPTTLGTNNITVKFEGNEKYNPSNETTTFIVEKIYTYLELSLPRAAFPGKSVEIDGYLYDERNEEEITFADIEIYVNGIKYTTQTDEYGEFYYTFTPTTLGTNNITIKYEGNQKYNPTNKKEIIEVKNRLNTYISLYLEDIGCIGESTDIEGYLRDENGKYLNNTEIQVIINKIGYTTQTDEEGYFNYTFTPTTLGTNNITIKYEGNEKYNTSTRTETIEVKNILNTYITVNSDYNAYLGEVTSLNGYLRDERGERINNTEIQVIINGIKYTTQTDKYGIYYYNFTPTTLGTNNITIKYEGNEKYNTSTRTETIEVKNRLYTFITLYSEDTGCIGESTNIYGYLYDERRYYPLNNTDLQLYINEIEHTIRTNEEGYFNYTFTPTTLGTNNITIKYEGNEKYYPTNKTRTMEIKSKLDTEISLHVDDIACTDESTHVYGYIYDERGSKYPVNNMDLVIIINEIRYTTQTDEKGYFNYTFTPSTSGTNNITAKFEGNEKYNPINDTTTVEVKKILDTYIETYSNDYAYLNGSTYIHGYLYDERGQNHPVNNTDILILVNGIISYQTATDEEGEFEYFFTPTTSGTNNITIKYEGNQKFNPTNTTRTIKGIEFNGEKLNTTITLSSEDTLYPGESTYIYGYLIDERGRDMINAEIQLIINGIKYTTHTDKYGDYYDTFTASTPGINTITVKFEGNQKYSSSNKTFTINVITPSHNIDTIVNATVNTRLVDNTSINITLTGADKNPIGNADIIITDTNNNPLATTTTNQNGKATVKLNLTSGTHTLNIIYNGNDTYNPSNNTLTINVEKLNTKLTVNTDKNLVDNTTITITLTDTTNNKQIGKTPITIYENNKQIATTTTDTNGKATIKLNLTSGTHTLNIKYNGNNTYKPSETNLNINVEKLNTKLTANTNQNLAGNTSISITLTDTTNNKAVSNAPITILDGSKQIASTTTTDVNGKATVKLSLTSGNHALNIKYNGNATYKASEDNVNINVVKLATTVTMNVPSTTNVGDMFTVNVAVKDQNNKAATGNVTIKVGNNTQSLPLTNGQASLPASINTTGKQDIVATYNGNEYNLASSKTTSITVNPAPTTTTIAVTNNTAGNVRVSGTVKDKSNRPVTTGTVTIKNGNTIVGTGQLTNGIYNILTNIGSAGSYPLTAQYSGSNNYLASSANTNVNVAFKTPSMTATVNGDKIGKTNVTATVKDPSGTGLNGVPIIVTLPNGTNITGTTGNNGVANIPVDVRENGTLTINYPGNGTYKAVSTSKPVSVTKNNPVIRLNPVKGVIGEDITLTAYLEDADGTPITGGNLAFKLNGKTLRSDGRFDSKAPAMKFKVENGRVTYKIKADLYLRNAKNLTASYSGNYKYVELNSESVEAQIQKRYAQVTTTVTPRIVKQYATLQLTATVKDITKNGKNTTLINQDTKVMFKVNGVTLKDSNGKTLYVPVGKNNKAVYNYIVPAGTGGITASKKVRDYKVDAIFMGDNYYPGARNVTTFNVERSATYVGITQVKASKTNVLSVSATLKDYKGNYLIGTNKVTIKINGKNYVNPATGKAVYWSVKDGKVSLSGIQVDPKTTIKRVMIVTGERQAYLEGRNETTNIIRA